MHQFAQEVIEDHNQAVLYYLLIENLITALTLQDSTRENVNKVVALKGEGEHQGESFAREGDKCNNMTDNHFRHDHLEISVAPG